eukprot:SAG31_NODE_55_length_29938_cov_9.154027_27_plen_91_part_00
MGAQVLLVMIGMKRIHEDGEAARTAIGMALQTMLPALLVELSTIAHQHTCDEVISWLACQAEVRSLPDSHLLFANELPLISSNAPIRNAM